MSKINLDQLTTDSLTLWEALLEDIEHVSYAAKNVDHAERAAVVAHLYKVAGEELIRFTVRSASIDSDHPMVKDLREKLAVAIALTSNSQSTGE